jgi:hypothetical protein
VTIDIETIDQLIRYEHTVEIWCPSCKRFGPDLDLKPYADAGMGGVRPKDLSLRHRECGTVLEITIRPPKGYGK